MIEDEEQPQLINTIGESPTEEVGTIEEDIYVLGVESLNGKTGDLSLKTINGEDLLEEGNIDLQTPLDSDQMAAVNSGIDAEKVSQIATNADNITTLQNTKQDNLTQTQLNAVNSGIDQTKVAQIATNTGNITSNTNRITTVEGKIPSAASSSNQLTDKNYVDNSIATNTANYISDNGMPFQSYADLEAYSGPLTNNDYAFVVSTDAAGNLLYTRYKYNASQELWAEEYTIANPTFTSGQWAAINSGVTQNDVNQIDTNKGDIAGLQTSKQDTLSQTQLDAINSGIDAAKVQQITDNTTAIATKQDKLIAGSNIQIGSDGKTISATDTTYTAGTGLTLTGTQFSVTEPVPAGFFTDTAAEQTGTGSIITLNNTVNAPIDRAELKGDTYQKTYSGKNLLPPPADFTDSLGTLTISCNGGVWTFSGTSQSGYTQSSKSVIAPYTIQSGDYFHYNNDLISTRINIALTFTDSTVFAASMNTANRIVSLEDYVGKTIASVRSNFNTGYEFNGTVKPMILNNVSTVTEFEPYVGGTASPNPSYPQQIDTVTGEQTVVVAGKNLFITDWEQGEVSNTTGQNIPSTAAVRTKDYIPVKPNQHYAINRSVTTSYTDVRCYDKNKGYIGTGSVCIDFISGQGGSSAGNPMVATAYRCVISPKEGTYYIRFNDFSNDTSTQYMMVEGDTQATYEPYQAQTYKVNLGKNLLNPSSTTKQSSSATKTTLTDGLRVTTSDSGNYTWVAFTIGPRSQFAGKTLVLKGNITASSTNTGSFGIGYSNADVSSRTSLGNISTSGDSRTYTITDDDPTKPYVYAIFYANAGGTASANDYVDYTNIQLEVGSTATSYAPYFTPIELCKIGTYQDYIWKDGSDWKVHKAIGKVVLNGTESWSGINSNACFFTGVADVYTPTQSTVADMRSDYYTPTTYLNLYNSNVSYGVGAHNTQARILIRNKDCADSTALITWLQSHNTTVYYPLATPTDTAIADAALIAQLEALGSSTTYSPQTNYSVLTPTPNLPTILTVDVFKDNYAGLLARLNKAGA